MSIMKRWIINAMSASAMLIILGVPALLGILVFPILAK